jgi:ubiquinone/menaquinone biosynthesis C-methylase UbiE
MRMIDPTRICPWWLAPTLDNPIRRLVHNPKTILSGYIGRGQTVLDLGCGSGTFTIAMAKMVGEDGKVIAVDVQDEMLQMVRKKAAKEGLESRIITHRSNPDRIGISDKVDFVLAFYMIHEVPNVDRFLREIVSLLKPKGKLLIVEPKLHVSALSFKRTLEAAQLAGLRPIAEPKIRFSRSALLQSPEGEYSEAYSNDLD